MLSLKKNVHLHLAPKSLLTDSLQCKRFSGRDLRRPFLITLLPSSLALDIRNACGKPLSMRKNTIREVGAVHAIHRR